MVKYSTKLKIADLIIKMQSIFVKEIVTKEEEKLLVSERFNNFSYKGALAPHIVIDIDIVNKLPDIINAKHLFTTFHFENGKENWRFLKDKENYIYKSPLQSKKQYMQINKALNRVKAYLLPKKAISAIGEEKKLFIRKHNGFVWTSTDIIYDFLQVLLITYFAFYNKGIFIHSVGMKDIDGKGLIFAGKSGAGKSTAAEIWHNNSNAMILNDDRIIVRKNKDKFFMYGSPWHGTFSDYLVSKIESAPLEKLLFIHHSPKNTVKKVSGQEAFKLLYPAIFPTFWDKKCLANITVLCLDMVNSIPCYKLGLVNNKKMINFVRDIK